MVQNCFVRSDDLESGRAVRRGRLAIVCGLPGSGKTTVARRLSDGGTAVRMCPDEWMDTLGINLWDGGVRAGIEAIQWDIAQELLALGGTVVIEWGTWAKAERDVLRLRARELGARVELWYQDVGIEELWRRVSSRQMEEPPIERGDLEAWFDQFQAPSSDEVALFDPH